MMALRMVIFIGIDITLAASATARSSGNDGMQLAERHAGTT